MYYSFKEVLPIIENLFGQECCKKNIGEFNALKIDFGDKIYHKRKSHLFKGTYRVGSYNSAWRIFKKNELLFGSADVLGEYEEYNEYLENIELGILTNIILLNRLDLSLVFNNGFRIDYLFCNSKNEDFHIFLPKNKVLVYSIAKGWEYGKSDISWPNHLSIS